MEYIYLVCKKKKKIHKFLLSLVLFSMLLKCFKYSTNIPKDNLIANNFIPKENI